MPQLEGQVGGHVAHDDVSQVVVFFAQAHERLAVDRLDDGMIGDRSNGCGAGPLIDEGHLAEDLAAPEVDDGPRAHVRLRAAQAHLDESVANDVQGIASRTLAGDRLTGEAALLPA